MINLEGWLKPSDTGSNSQSSWFSKSWVRPANLHAKVASATTDLEFVWKAEFQVPIQIRHEHLYFKNILQVTLVQKVCDAWDIERLSKGKCHEEGFSKTLVNIFIGNNINARKILLWES